MSRFVLATAGSLGDLHPYLPCRGRRMAPICWVSHPLTVTLPLVAERGPAAR